MSVETTQSPNHPVPQSPSPGWLTTGQAAAQIGCTSQHVRNLIEGGEMEAKNIAQGFARKPMWRISQVTVDEYIDSRPCNLKAARAGTP